MRVDDSGAVPVDDVRDDLLVALPTDAVLCDLSAACAQGLWVPDRPDRLVVCVPGRGRLPRDRPHSRRSHVQHRRRMLQPGDVVVVDHVPMTSPARTWIDLAESLDVRDLVALGDSVLRSGVVVTELELQLRRAARRRGVVRAREALAHLDARSRSRPESCLRYLLVASGLPAPEVNVPVVVDGVWLAEPDLVYREARIAIEYQGGLHADPARMRRDITRKLDLEAAGWLVIEVGPAEVFRFPDRIVHRVRFELERRTPR